jgi:hypothetical protein
MRNNSIKFTAFAIFLFVALGCSYIDTAQRAIEETTTNTNSATNAAREITGLRKTGIPECDQLVDVLAERRRQNSNGEQTWTDKATEEIVKQLVYDQLSKNDTNRTPQEKADLAKNCKIALDYLK